MYDFTPHVCILSEDSILLEVASCLKLFDGIDTLQIHIQNRLYQLGYSAKIGISTTGLGTPVLQRKMNFLCTQLGRPFLSCSIYLSTI